MVTASYLRAWADAKKVVAVIDKQHGRKFRISYTKATVVNYAYEPNILTHDLEQEYAVIEANGIPVINKLRDGHTAFTDVERKALIAFLDMHLDRGRYANQAKVMSPATMLNNDASHKNGEMNAADRLFLSQYLPEVPRLSKLGIEEWPWQIWPVPGLVTGDGAVLLWSEPGSEEVITICFPLSPTRLLVIGQDLPDGVWLNGRIAENSKRWIIGEVGSLNLNSATGEASKT